MSTATDARPAAEAVYESLPTVDEGWAFPQAVAEATGMGYSTVTRHLRALRDAGRVESSDDPDHTGGSRGTVWRQRAEVPAPKPATAAATNGGPADDGGSASDAAPTGDAAEPCQRTDLPEDGEAHCAGCGFEASEHPAWRAESFDPAEHVQTVELSDETPLTKDEARALTDQIRGTVLNLLPLIQRAYQRRADLALGYESWSAYCDAELRGLRMPLGERQQAHAELRAAGMSTRAIAGATGSSEATVRRDLRDTGAADDAPERARGLDGRSYATSRPKPKPEPETAVDRGPRAAAADGAEGADPRPDEAPVGDGGSTVVAVPGTSPVVQGELLPPARPAPTPENVAAVAEAVRRLALAIDSVEEALIDGTGGPGTLPDLRHERGRVDKLIRRIAA